jgi:hypothetical protein
LKIISFAYTTPEFKKGIKTATRRTWNDGYAALWKKGDKFQAYDRQARFGGKCIGYGVLTEEPFKQWLHDMTEHDLKEEGGRWKTVEDFTEGFGGDREVWVVKFRKLNLQPHKIAARN